MHNHGGSFSAELVNLGKQRHISAYVLLFLLVPFINTALQTLNRRSYLTLLGVLGTVWLIIPSLCKVAPLQGPKFFENPGLFLLYAYLWGAYLRLFHAEAPLLSKAGLRGLMVCSLPSLALLLAFCELHALPRSQVIFYWYWLTEYNFILIPLTGLLLFELLRSVRPFSSALINRLAPCMLGVYLLHNNPYGRDLLWLDHVRLQDHLHSPWCLPYVIAVILAVFLGCTAVEYVRHIITVPLSSRCAPLLERADALFKHLTPSPPEIRRPDENHGN